MGASRAGLSGFVAILEEAPRGGAYIRIPPDVVEALGGGGRIPVRATFDGIDYRGSVVRMGGDSVLGVLKEIREELGKAQGDELEVTIVRDEAERVVEIPPRVGQAPRGQPRRPRRIRRFELLPPP